MEEKIVYFEESGIANTEQTLRLSYERALKRNIKHIVLASTRGYTAQKALEIIKNNDIHLVAIPHQYGSTEGDLFDPKTKKAFKEAGHDVFISTHLFSTQRFWGIPRAPGTFINALYRFCQGMKVCVEITLMAANGGKIPVDQDVIAIGGTDIGADTAIIISSSTSSNFENLRIKEIICKPLYSKQFTRETIEKRVRKLKQLRDSELIN